MEEGEAPPEGRNPAPRDAEAFVLPPVERPRNATLLEKRLAILRMLEQAAQEREPPE